MKAIWVLFSSILVFRMVYYCVFVLILSLVTCLTFVVASLVRFFYLSFLFFLPSSPFSLLLLLSPSLPLIPPHFSFFVPSPFFPSLSLFLSSLSSTPFSAYYLNYKKYKSLSPIPFLFFHT